MRRLAALLATTLGAALGAGWTAPAAAAGDGADRQSISHGGAQRTYVVRVPARPPAGTALPLVLVLHGGGGNAANVEAQTGFTEKARAEGFIVAYPEGSGRLGGKLLTWNAGHCCGHAMQRGVDDVGFIDALIDRLSRDHPVDARRIYVTGISNGGMMSHRIGIELAPRIAAIAPVVGALFGDERPAAQGVSLLAINGMRDQSVPHLGGAPGGRFPGAWDGTPVKPSIAQAAFWAAASGCDAVAERRDTGFAFEWRHRCPEGRAVQAVLLKDVGHAWPGGQRGTRRADDPGTDWSATDAIWAFFRAQRK